MEDDLVEVRRSPVHGNGVFAKWRVRRATVIGRYEGRRYLPGETIESTAEDGVTYLFSLSDGGTIDGAEGGNATRFINHSCMPNCEAREGTCPEEGLFIEVHALKTIPAGAELFLDYRLVRDPDDPHEHACVCGTKKCRGTMVWPVDPEAEAD